MIEGTVYLLKNNVIIQKMKRNPKREKFLK